MIPMVGPKYEVGQIVYYADTRDQQTPLPCPDCLDTKSWTITTPAGETFRTPCRRCQGSFYSGHLPRVPSLWKVTFTPIVTMLTVGQVRMVIPPREDEDTSYMCEETGVGYGRCYRECELFASVSEAEDAANVKIQNAEKQWSEKTDQIKRSDLATLQLSHALGKAANQLVWDACYHYGQLKEHVEDWLQGKEFNPTEAQAALMREVLHIELPWHVEPKRNPIAALVLAARAVNRYPSNVELSAALERFEKLVEPAPSTEVDGFL